MILAPDGIRIRREVEVPADVLRELQSFHPLLGMKYLPFQKCWAIVWYWDDNDPRRVNIQGGHTTPKDAHSIVCEVPRDCSALEAVNYAKRNLIINPPAKMWEQVAKRVEQYNENAMEAVSQAALADVYNRIEVSAAMTKFHFAENVEEADIQSYTDLHEIEKPSPEEIRAVENGGVFD